MSSSKLPELGPRPPGSSDGERGLPGSTIPRLSLSTPSKSRISHACNRCRLMRTKCTGGDRCIKCIKDDAECSYGDRKREKNKKDLVESLERIDVLEGEVQQLLSALRALATSPSFQPSEHDHIVQILSKYSSQEQQHESQESSSSWTQSRPSPPRDTIQSDTGTGDTTVYRREFRRVHLSGEHSVSTKIGAPGRLDELAMVVDLDSGKGASGYVGKMSEITWIQRAWEHLSDRPRKGDHAIRPEVDRPFSTTQDCNYFMDDHNVLAIDEDDINELDRPPIETAVILSEAFFHALQGAFYFVGRDHFLSVLHSFPQQNTPVEWSQRRWLALANIVWAIGSKWLQISKLDHIYRSDSHLVYYARARRLGLDHRIMFDHPDIERVQAMGILAFYLFTNGSIARSWNTLGQATRHATALGMHLRVGDPSTRDDEKDKRARTWYSLYSLEVLIAEVTGRPKSVSLSDATISMDAFRNLDDSSVTPSGRLSSFESSSNSRKFWLDFLNTDRDIPQGMTGGVIPWKNFATVGRNSPVAHFPQRLLLCRLSDKIASELYSGNLEMSWAQIQRKIGHLQTELRHWVENLPDDLVIQSKSPTDSDPRVKIELSMYYHSVQMILHRHCLCETVIENESVRSQEFNRSCARACVHAAMSMLAVMPDNPSAHEAYQLLPFWALLHYIAQAAAVLLLELSLDSQHFPNESAEVVNYLRKAMAYLWCMTENSFSAYRAWRILRTLLTDVAERYEDLYIGDIPQEARQPTGWTEEDDEARELT